MPSRPPERRRLLACLLGLFLTAPLLTACSDDDPPEPDRPSAQARRHHEKKQARAHLRRFDIPPDVVAALRALLDRRALALTGHDESAFTAGLGQDPGFRGRQATYYANLVQLPVDRLAFDLDPATLVRDGSSYWADVDVSLQLVGFDDRPVHSPDRYRFTRRGDRFVLSSVTDRAWEKAHGVTGQPWDDQTIVVRRGPGVLGIFDPVSVAQASAVMRAVRQGVSQVQAVVPLGWDGTVVVYALGDTRFLDTLPDVPGEVATAVDALTFPVFARPGSHRLAAMRFVLNPRLLAEPGRARDRLIRHELTHVAMGRRDDQLPVWLSEGVAEWVSVQALAPEDRVISAAAIRAAHRGLTSLPADETFNGPGAAANYGIAWWACEAIVDGYGAHTLWTTVEDMAGNPDPDAELEVLLGIGPARLAAKAGRLMLATYDPERKRDRSRSDQKDEQKRG